MARQEQWQVIQITCYAYQTKEQLGKTKKRYNYKEPHGIYIDQNRYCTATLCAVTKCPLHKPEQTEQNQHAEKR